MIMERFPYFIEKKQLNVIGLLQAFESANWFLQKRPS